MCSFRATLPLVGVHCMRILYNITQEGDVINESRENRKIYF